METAVLIRPEISVALGIGVLLTLLLWWRRPSDRPSARNALLLLGACALTEVAASGLASWGRAGPAAILAEMVTIVIGWVLLRLTALVLFRVLLRPLLGSTPRIVEDLVVAVLFVGWGLVWLRWAGVDLGSLVTTSAIITAVLAFAMQDTLGNILGGVVLQLDDSIRVGDWVKFDTVEGQVVEIRWRHTAVETRDRETVMIPNSWLMKNRFNVVGSRQLPEQGWRRWVWFNIEPGQPVGHVVSVLERAVREANIRNVAREPAPDAILVEVRPGYARYALRFWVIDPRPVEPTSSAVQAHALAALARQGIQLGIPQEERLIFKDNETRRAANRNEELKRRRAALAGTPLFQLLTEAERDELAENLVRAPFVSGDTLMRQGTVAHWLYLIVAGEVEVWVEQAEGRQHVSDLGPGEIFGEMGLLTGEPRRATVIAKSDVECYRLDKPGFERVLLARPDIAAEMSQVLARRLSKLEAERATLQLQRRPIPRRDDILERIRSFFRLDVLQ